MVIETVPLFNNVVVGFSRYRLLKKRFLVSLFDSAGM